MDILVVRSAWSNTSTYLLQQMPDSPTVLGNAAGAFHARLLFTERSLYLFELIQEAFRY